MTELTITERWEQGIPHDPRSEEIVRAMAKLDWELCDGALDIQCGGDGDNGETMMFLLDVYFERKDKTKYPCFYGAQTGTCDNRVSVAGTTCKDCCERKDKARP